MSFGASWLPLTSLGLLNTFDLLVLGLSLLISTFSRADFALHQSLHQGKGIPFVSAALGLPTQSFTAMALALAVLDVPFTVRGSSRACL